MYKDGVTAHTATVRPLKGGIFMSKQSGYIPRAVIVVRTVSLAFALLLLGAMILYMARIGGQTESVLSKTGSRGNEVRQIQQRLKNWGYYTGEVDGIFGVETKKAVMSFQRKNGLTVDGIAGNATLKAMGIQSSQQTGGSGGYSSSDIALLANIISAEARGEPFEGQVAVGAVVLNRGTSLLPRHAFGRCLSAGRIHRDHRRPDQRSGRRISQISGSRSFGGLRSLGRRALLLQSRQDVKQMDSDTSGDQTHWRSSLLQLEAVPISLPKYRRPVRFLRSVRALKWYN